MSTHDIEAALTETLKVEGVSKSTASTLCSQPKHDFDRWQSRDLSDVDLFYLFCNGVYLRLLPEDPNAVAVLCAYGIKSDGRKVLLHLAVGDKESTVCWKSFFQDLEQRGLAKPLLVIIDGNSGLTKAVRESFPGSWAQRCPVHREQFPEAMKCLATGLEECLRALRFPETHRKRIRTTNLFERLFGEGRRRSKVIPRFMSERLGLGLMFAVLVDAPAGWRGVNITPAISRKLDSLKIDSTAKRAVQLEVWVVCRIGALRRRLRLRPGFRAENRPTLFVSKTSLTPACQSARSGLKHGSVARQ